LEQFGLLPGPQRPDFDVPKDGVHPANHAGLPLVALFCLAIMIRHRIASSLPNQQNGFDSTSSAI
jgi:hypothetical protein